MRAWWLVVGFVAAAGCDDGGSGDEGSVGTTDGGGDGGATDGGAEDADGDGWTVADGDCDDGDPAVNPGAEEVCNGVDDDCDGTADVGAADAATWYADADGDGWGDEAEATTACGAPAGHVAEAGDCDDGDPAVNPGAEEVCNGVDDDCDGVVDPDDAADAGPWYTDGDGDGYGDDATELWTCSPPSGVVGVGGDCDDGEATIHPGADEHCDDLDEDCDGEIDEDPVDALDRYRDVDGDGWGVETDVVASCDLPSGYAWFAGDCDDTDADVNPDAEETCNGVDDDCDGLVDWGHAVPTDYATITDAIDALSDGDTICVSAGTYAENIDFTGKDLRVIGWEGAASTTIEGDGTGPVVTFDSGETADALLSGFTITGGEATAGAGISVSASDPTLQDLVVSGNTCSTGASCAGVGIHLSAATASLEGVEITGNTVSSTGTVASFTSTSGSVTTCGVGLAASASVLDLVDVTVTDNVDEAQAAFRVTSTGVGACFDATEVTWTGGTVAGNALRSGSAAEGQGAGGGIYATDSVVELANLVVADNALAGNAEDLGGGIAVDDGTVLILANVIVAGNAITGGSTARGGGIYLGTSTAAELENCDVTGNEVGGTGGQGGGLYGYYLSDLVVVNTNFVSNAARSGGAMEALSGSLIAGQDVTWSNFWDNGADAVEGYDDPSSGTGNIASDPLYADVTAPDAVDWDLTLGTGSPCVDAGDPSITDTDGSTSDIGAYGGPGAAGW